MTAEAILAPHVRETLGRVQQDPVTLVVHDARALGLTLVTHNIAALSRVPGLHVED